MRRFFVLLTVMVIVASLALPVFAAGSGGGRTLYAPIYFDTMTIGSNESLDWFMNYNNTANVDKKVVVSTEFNDTWSIDVDCRLYNNPNPVGYNVMAQLPCPSSSFSLLADMQFFQFKTFKNNDFHVQSLGDDHSFDTVTLECRAQYITGAAGAGSEARFGFKDISYQWRPNDNFFSISQALCSLIENSSWYDGSICVFLTNVKWTFNMLWESSDTPQLLFSCNNYSLTGPENDVRIWVVEQGLWTSQQPAPETPKVELVSWLGDAAQSVLSFEIFPGVSFMGLLGIFITVGFVLWFIKVVR